MSDDAERLRALRGWVRKAEGDLAAAEHLLRAGATPPWVSAFHAQQCAEKYLKALLAALDLPFPKTHDIQELVGMLPIGQQPPVDPGLAADLTDHAVADRYPGAPEPTLAEAEEAIRAARLIRDWVRSRLPADALNI